MQCGAPSKANTERAQESSGPHLKKKRKKKEKVLTFFKARSQRRMVKEHKKEIRKTEVQMLKIMKRLSSPLMSKETQNYNILFFSD